MTKITASFLALSLVTLAASDNPFAATSTTQSPAKKYRQPAALAEKKSVAKASTAAKSLREVRATQASHASSFISQQAQRVLSNLKSQPVRAAGAPLAETTVAAGASKSEWLRAIYSRNIVEASWATEMLSDKRILAEVIKRELGADADVYYPRTLGLKEFLKRRKFINQKGLITASGEQIESALYEEFPAGFLVRPAVGVAPQETGRGLYPESDQFIVDLLKPASPLYSPSHAKRSVRSTILDGVASGEAIVLQENFVAVADAKKPLKMRFFNEVRVHTYEGRVVVGAVPTRWVQTNLLSDDDIAKAELFAGEFLKKLPMQILTRQAWGIDVAVMDNGEMRIADVVTNRGVRGGAWSGYLDQPRVIGAYSRHFEELYGLKFEGLSGALIRNNLANYMPYWEKKRQKAKPGLMGKITAYLPPVP